MYHYVIVVQFVLVLVVVGVDCIEMQIANRPPVRNRIERMRFQLILLVLWVVHRAP